MGPTEKLINEFSKRGHPLGRSISEEEVPTLIEALRQRLGVSSRDLDLSPQSLKRLEQCLVELHRKDQEQRSIMGEEEVVRLIREVAAYIGQVLVIHTGGRWRTIHSLYGTEIVFDGGTWAIVKNNKVRWSSHGPVYTMGGEAAWAWDAIVAGRKPNLYRLYREARTRRLREGS
jgi:hypothetical protein